MSVIWTVCQGKLLAEETVRLRGYECCNQKGHGVGLAKPFGAHISRTCAVDTGHEVAEPNVCLAGFRSCFGPTRSFYAPIPHFGMRNICSVQLYIGYTQFAFNFYRSSQPRVCLKSQMRLCT